MSPRVRLFTRRDNAYQIFALFAMRYVHFAVSTRHATASKYALFNACHREAAACRYMHECWCHVEERAEAKVDGGA